MKISNETKVGVLTTVSIVFLILGYNFLVGKDLFTSSQQFYAKYKRIDGLSVSNPVFLYGYKIGKVEQVKIISALRPEIQVKFSVGQDIQIPEGTTARIFSSDLLGSKAIEIIPAKESEVYVSSGDTLIGENEPSISESLTQVIDPVKKKTVSLISSVDTVVTIFKGILEEGGAKQNLQKSLSSLNKSLKSLETTTYRLDTLVVTERTRLRKIFSYTEEITKNLRDNNEELTNVIKNVSNISDSIAASNIKQTLMKTNSAIGEVNETMRKINQGEGSLGKLVNDDKLYQNLEDASKELDALLNDMRSNPQRYVQFSVLSIGKGKKSEQKDKKEKADEVEEKEKEAEDKQ